MLNRSVMATYLVDIPTVASGYATAASRTEQALAEVLAELVQADQVSIGSHFFDDLGADSMVMARFCARVRKRDDLPSVSMKDIYQHPTIEDLAANFAEPEPAPPSTNPHEAALAEVLAGVVQVSDVTVDSHFFDDLGADSMVMARFCARVRKRADLPSVSMKDIYRCPTIKSLAAAFAVPAATLPAKTLPVRDLAGPAPSEPPVPTTTTAAPPAGTGPHIASTGQYVLCGALQFLVFVGNLWLYVIILTSGFLWVAAATGVDIYLRSVLFTGGVLVSACAFSIIGKWVLVGRWKRQQIRVWSLGYFRFWLVKSMIRTNPLALIGVGTPVYSLYLRALGARIGKGVVIFSPTPVCTDLLAIGDGTVVRKGALMSGYRAHAGRIETGSVTLGREVVVSEATVLDIETSMGDQAQLGHASSLHSGQAVPAGERWHGSPAQRTEVDYRAVPPTTCGTLRRVLYPLAPLLLVVFGLGPLGFGVFLFLLRNVPLLPALLDSPVLTPAGLPFYRQALVASFVVLISGLILGLVFVGTVPRLVNLAIKPEKVYPLFGIHYFLHGMVARLTNVAAFTHLFGDSSYIVYYLRYLGYNLNKVEQTGSNFGTVVVHENPYLSAVGSGTVVADGLSINNADYSSSSFRVSPTTIGAHSFLGNNIAYPSQAKVGDNCLLANKVMVPIQGTIREGVGLLGSPSFEIPRSVLRDTRFSLGSAERGRRLAAKNRHNLATIGLALLMQWVLLYVFLMLAMVVTDLYRGFGPAGLVPALLAFALFTLAYLIVVERASTGFRPLRPQNCSIYDPYFWWHERFWKLSVQGVAGLLAGTPFKTVVLRLLGVRMGRRVFDDGCGFVEKTLVTVGDYCTLNAGSIIQAHSQEDGAFKSDYIAVGSGCTVGVGAWIHYGVTMGDGAVLAPDSFLMKGEQVPPYAYWGGNPAEERQGSAADSRILSRATSSSSPPEPWSWDLDLAALAASSAKTNGTDVSQPAPEEPWSWELEFDALAASSAKKNGKGVPQPSPEEPWSWDLDLAVLEARQSPNPDWAVGHTEVISVEVSVVSVKPFQKVRIHGTYRGGAHTLLQVQSWERGRWLAFPSPTKTDRSGHFATHVELGQPGRYRLRVLDPGSGLTSKTFVLMIKDEWEPEERSSPAPQTLAWEPENAEAAMPSERSEAAA